MTSLEKTKHKIIDKILLVRDEDLLKEIDYLIHSKSENLPMELNEPQIEMINRGLDDIENNRLHTEDDLETDDLEWLK